MAPLAYGDVETAREAAAQNVRVFADLVRAGYTIICSEPTAVLMLTQEYPGLLDDPVLWLQAPLGDDPLLGLLSAAAGFELESFDAEGEPFAVRHRGLPDTPERLIERGHSIIHSLKDYAQQREEGLRSFFREHRKRTAQVPAPRRDGIPYTDCGIQGME